jgi:hypothetical protein
MLHSNTKIIFMVTFLGFAGNIWRTDYSGCKNYHFRFGSLDLSSFLVIQHSLFTHHVNNFGTRFHFLS